MMALEAMLAPQTEKRFDPPTDGRSDRHAPKSNWLSGVRARVVELWAQQGPFV
jgi:hypothetical protein